LTPWDPFGIGVVEVGGIAARPTTLDAGLDALAPELRWPEWMGRVEAVIFADGEARGSIVWN
jgi:hypothetical protein